MLDVVAAWCGPCKIMDKTTFADPGVVAWAKKTVVPARVDAEKGEGRRISARYQAYSFPTVALPRRDGNEIDRARRRLPGRATSAARRGRPRREDAAPRGPREAQGEVGPRGGDRGRERARAAARPRAAPADRAARRLRGRRSEPAGSLPALRCSSSRSRRSRTTTPRETGDLIATFLPRLGTDPRRGFFAAAFVTALGKRGDVATARAVDRGDARRRSASPGRTRRRPRGARRRREAGRARRRGARRLPARGRARREEPAPPPGVRVERQLDLAEALAASGRTGEAKKAYLAAIAIGRARRGPLRAGVPRRARRSRTPPRPSSTRAAPSSSRRARTPPRRPRSRRRSARRATAPARRPRWKRASELDPKNAEYRTAAPEPAKKKAAKAS